ncbi:hypothetical protein [Candidatus Regiella insecticola]|uniref:Uncharacterized protein n=1 Tax=Candidatus Regiella insecticola TaxID=138073 RepID=A0A6L2ZNV8_9ENTR|nr:hypothetical protein [Candidatus Regiella insecticola]GFN46094.1 hypothetical protein RINTU1_15320 [Candidatus Regiella insecticola]
MFGIFKKQPQPLQSQSHFFTSETSFSDATPDSIKNTSSSFHAKYDKKTLEKTSKERDPTSLAQIVSKVRDSMPDGTESNSSPIPDAMVTREKPHQVGKMSNFLLPTGAEVRREREEAYSALNREQKMVYLFLSEEKKLAYLALTTEQRKAYWNDKSREMQKAELAV